MLLCGKEIGAVDRTWHDVRLCVLREHRGPAQPPLQCTLCLLHRACLLVFTHIAPWRRCYINDVGILTYQQAGQCTTKPPGRQLSTLCSSTPQHSTADY